MFKWPDRVYLARQKGTKLFKIGASQNLDLRLRELGREAGRPYLVDTIWQLDTASAMPIEKIAHKLLWHVRAIGISGMEHYRLPKPILIGIINEAIAIHRRGTTISYWVECLPLSHFANLGCNIKAYVPRIEKRRLAIKAKKRTKYLRYVHGIEPPTKLYRERQRRGKWEADLQKELNNTPMRALAKRQKAGAGAD